MLIQYQSELLLIIFIKKHATKIKPPTSINVISIKNRLMPKKLKENSNKTTNKILMVYCIIDQRN